jgi:hypothetical protein
MTVLGLNRDACVNALESYLARFRELEAAAGGESGSGGTGAADAMLDRLLFQLEVDAQSRSSAPGRERMSPIETSVFAPLVEDLRHRLVRLTSVQPPKTWVPVLMTCEAAVMTVLQHLH